MATITALVRYAAMSTEGKELRSLHNRMTAVMRKQNGSWKVTYEHTSAPIDHTSLKANLKFT